MSSEPLTRTVEERREYFRVEDNVLLSWCAVSADERCRPPEEHFGNSELFRLMRELRGIDAEHSSFLRTLTERDRELSSHLKSINRKLELVVQTLTALHTPSGATEPQSVSLSETGIAFMAPAPVALGTLLALEVTLLPQHAAIAAYGEVVANRTDAPGRTVVNFVDLRQSDRQTLARHLLQVQIAARRRHS